MANDPTCSQAQDGDVTVEELIETLEAVAPKLGLSPGTLGERAGQGGQFYRRLKNGKRSWPETVNKAYRNVRLIEAEHDSAKTGIGDRRVQRAP